MKKIAQSALLTSLLAAVVTVPSAAQQKGERTPSPIIEEIIREKTRYSEEEIRRALEERTSGRDAIPERSDAGVLSSGAAGSEVAVSDDSAPESEVHAAINPLDSSNIIISPIRYSGIGGDGLQCPIYYTKDFGKTWEKSSFHTLPDASNVLLLGGGDPLIVFDADGRAVITWINLYLDPANQSAGARMELYWAISEDGGATWEKKENALIGGGVIAGGSVTQGAVFDKQWLVCDATGGTYHNTIYAAFMETDGIHLRIGVRKKEPSAESFSGKTSYVSDDSFEFAQFSSLDVDPAGNVHVTFFGTRDAVAEGYAMWHAMSSDGGETFTDPARVAGVTVSGRFGGKTQNTVVGVRTDRIYPCPHVKIDKSGGPADGTIHLVWSADGLEEAGETGMDIYYVRSTDNGATWSEPRIINDDPTDRDRHQFYPSLDVNDQGTVIVTWYDRREDGNNNRTHYYMTYSFDGGETFEPNFPVSTLPTSFSTIGNRNGGFGIGEYNQVISTGGYAIPVWADGRTNNGNLDIYAAFVPIVRNASSAPERTVGISEKFGLSGVVPNPISAENASVSFQLAERSHCRLMLVNTAGEPVATLADGTFQPGAHTVSLDASGLAAGNYHLLLETDFGTSGGVVTVVR